MIKKLINFFDHHRLLLVLFLLLLIVIIFLGVNSYFFFHHDFKAFPCTEEIDDEYCYYENTKIFSNPEESKNKFFEQYQDEIENLQEEYHLKDFSFYTAYYYAIAAQLNYKITGEYKVLEDFFETYVNTYDLEDFYKEQSFYFNLYYRFKIN